MLKQRPDYGGNDTSTEISRHLFGNAYCKLETEDVQSGQSTEVSYPIFGPQLGISGWSHVLSFTTNIGKHHIVDNIMSRVCLMCLMVYLFSLIFVKSLAVKATLPKT